MTEKTKTGLIQIYTGEGKGKTTAALGLAVRAAGQGMKVGFIQFLKGESCGELSFVSRYPAFKIIRLANGDCFSKSRGQLSEDAQNTLAFAEEQILNGNYDLLVLDEIFIAVYKGLISVKQVLSLLDQKPPQTEIILTGRYAPAPVIERADLVTEMRMIKHPFQKGIAARAGIEY